MKVDPVAGDQYQISGLERTEVIPNSEHTGRYSALN
jgi:hypothetical protein